MLLSRRAGLDFSPLDPFPDTAWLPFPVFGYERKGTENVVWDRRRGADVRVFDLWYQEPGDERPVGGRRRLTCAVVPLPATCPRMRVSPREAVDDAIEALGGAASGSSSRISAGGSTWRRTTSASPWRSSTSG